MENRNYGKTDIKISTLGFGAGHLGDESITDKEAMFLLDTLIDNGINFIDTARGYGMSEERIGKSLQGKRNKVVISTKVGYGIDGSEDWTYPCIIKGVERALKLMKTDFIDIVHLHSCSKHILENGEVIQALIDCKQAGKIRALAYSGENEDLKFALDSNQFDGLQFSLNIFDQQCINEILPEIHKQRLGVIAKRPLANTAWKFAEQPIGNYAETYWKRCQKMALNIDKSNYDAIAIRFACFTYGVTSAIAGSTKVVNSLKNIEAIRLGKLDEHLYSSITNRFKICNENWIGQL